MRIKRVEALGERKPIKPDAEKVKYYLVCEGLKTEPAYFEALNRHREELGIHPRTELVPVDRSYIEKKLTNPKTLAETVKRYRDENDTGRISYYSLIACIVDYIVDNEKLPMNVAPKLIRTNLSIALQHMQKKLTDTFPTEDLESVCGQLSETLLAYEREGWTGVIKDIPDIMEGAFDGYNKEVDKICLIVDRDPESFTVDQYHTVLRICHEENTSFQVFETK